jgi:hypothetical protein
MRSLCLLIIILAMPGCGGEPVGTVSGAVTLNGEPLDKALINFTSEDGEGGTAGGEVLEGRYSVSGLRPGKYHVHIAGQTTAPVIMPNSPDAQRTLSQKEIEAMMDPLPPNATGNDQVIEVKAGSQTHDFQLEGTPRS